MFISSFSRIDTVTVPDVFMSVVKVSEGERVFDAEGIKAILETDRDSIDYLAIVSDTDPLCFSELYKLIRTIRPSGLKVMIVTDGRDPSVLDDLVGAGYAHAVNLKIGRELTEDQERCIGIAGENGCNLVITIDLAGHNEASVSAVAKSLKNCKTVVLRQAKNSPQKKSEISAIFSAVKRYIRNVKLI